MKSSGFHFLGVTDQALQTSFPRNPDFKLSLWSPVLGYMLQMIRKINSWVKDGQDKCCSGTFVRFVARTHSPNLSSFKCLDTFVSFYASVYFCFLLHCVI